MDECENLLSLLLGASLLLRNENNTTNEELDTILELISDEEEINAENTGVNIQVEEK
jgi:hypothetical protein